ncbi:MAG: Gfo/Idh/MocA family oxidoreductase, partial [Bacteroidetes bacterium]|nr:Gfo/Idh/MocA family oxidoreductase [Bacteroidota bacterium]
KRRNFVKTSLLTSAGVVIAPTILTSCSNWKGANDRVNVAHIGVGGRGRSTTTHYFLPQQGSRSLAVCDPFTTRRENFAKFIENHYATEFDEKLVCQPYLDFEEILERKDIDAVHISTGDYWHLPIAIKAAQAGKHIYLEKPLGLSLDNMLILEKEAKKNKVHFHYGTQQRSLTHCQNGIEMIRSGRLGEISYVDVWAPEGSGSPVKPDDKIIPDGFDFDRWLGPAPLAEYSFARCRSATGVYHTYDYAIGFIAGWGAHPLDIAVWGVKEKMNDISSHKGTGSLFPEGMLFDTITSWDVNIKYNKGLTVHFMSTDLARPVVSEYLPDMAGDGTAFFGEKGWISISRGQIASNIPEIHNELNVGVVGENGKHGENFIKTIKGEIKEIAPLEDAIISDCISHMGNISIRSGNEVKWDAVKREFPDAPGLEKQYFHRNPRKS